MIYIDVNFLVWQFFNLSFIGCVFLVRHYKVGFGFFVDVKLYPIPKNYRDYCNKHYELCNIVLQASKIDGLEQKKCQSFWL